MSFNVLCECGCGTPVTIFRGVPKRFVHGHGARGKRLNEEHRRHISEGKRGTVFSEEHRRKLSEAQRCRKPATAETRRRIGQAGRGRVHSAETKRKIGKGNKGDRNGSWRGGISFEPYGPEFNDALRLVIRERDGFACRLCTMPENGQPHCCHHIDYDKTNNDPRNFVLLCLSCHPKTNHNRAFWMRLFQGAVVYIKWNK